MNYLEILAGCFPGAEAYTFGDPTDYNDLVWITTPIPQATLDASDCGQGNDPTEDPVTSAFITGIVGPNDVLKWDDTLGTFIPVAPLEPIVDNFNTLGNGDSLTWNSAAGKFLPTPGGGGVTNHGDLTGLGDDDHPQYVLAAGDTMTGVLQIINGTAGAPSIAFSDDTDTGIYSPVDGSIAFTTNGTDRGGFSDVGLTLINGSALRFIETGGGNDAIQFVGPAATTGVTWTLPGADGTNGQALTTDGSGGLSWATPSASPAGSDGQIQYNNGGAFGANAALSFDDTNLEVNILGNAADTQLTVGGTSRPDAGLTDATLYVEVMAPGSDIDGIQTYFSREAVGINGWIANAYDGATPYVRIVDEDDDAPYVRFVTIGAGTEAAPDFEMEFGMRNDPVGGTAGATTGYQWLVNGADMMHADTNFLTIPRDTTANRPSAPANGMIRYNTTLNEFEGYQNGAWVPLVSRPKEVFLSHNGAVTQTLTTTFVTALFNTSVRSDSSFSYASGVVTINKTAWFRVTAEVTGDSTGARSTLEARLAVNGSPVTGTLGYGYHRNTGSGEDTTSIEWYVNNTSGDTVEVEIRETTGAVVTVANACRLLIEEVDNPS